MKTLLALSFAALCLSFGACNSGSESVNEKSADSAHFEINASALKTEDISYGDNQKGFIAYDPTLNRLQPIVLVVPEWWGLNDYAKKRAEQLAGLGYFAIAVDMYGDGKVASTPDEAGKLAGQFYGDPNLGKSRLEAALAKAKTYNFADTGKVAIIGYCFGGTQALNFAKIGMPIDAAVSFHGSMPGVPPLKGIQAQMLVCHGEADSNVKAEDVATFKKQLDAVGAKYTFKTYPNATHAFTNPDATATGEKYGMPIRYNGAADTASWNDMKTFLSTVFQ